MKYYLLILLLIVLTNTHSQHNCVFNKLYKDIKITTYVPPHYQSSYQTIGRALPALIRLPMRITLDATDFDTIKSGSNGAPTPTTTQLNFIKRTMQVAQAFYQLRLKVTRAAQVFPQSPCVDYTPPGSDVSIGIASSDLHIYVRYAADSSLPYGATGASCNYYPTTTFPDTQLQMGRPTAGRIIFNTYNLLLNTSSLSSRLFASITSTALHQTLHILGFDYRLYDTYLDPGTFSPYSYNVTSTSAQINPSRVATNLLITPFVTQWAKQFFNCSSITGMQLENEDNLAIGSHWERMVMYDELMTGTALGPQKGISGLTFALLKDMGWYEVDDTFNDTNNYGYQKGCGFYNNGCYDNTTTFTQFCNSVTLNGSSICASNFLGKSVCTNQTGFMADGCGQYASYFGCVDPAQIDDGYKSITFESYGTNSFCVQSTFSTSPVSATVRARCYPYTCNAASQSITFTVNTNYVTCTIADVGVSKTLSSFAGYLKCPAYADYCTNSRKICPNWCSQNGFCTRGVCNCLPGYSGQDCSITICSSTQYYNPGTTSCLTICPSGTYQNIYSRTCLPCASPCSQCRDQSTICTSCPNANPTLVKYNNSCITSCPSSTFLNGDVCEDCNNNSTYNCLTCSMASTNCTSCSGGLFLSGPDFGTCGSSCSGINNKKDIVNNKCVYSCDYNLIEIPGLICDMCPSGQFKRVGQTTCFNSCADTFYPDNTLRYCISCDSTCLKCNGKYPQNCTQCKTTGVNLYFLSNMCLSSCPRGFYANATSGACQVCTVQKNCATCTLDNSTIYCLTCKYGYYFQTNRTCLASCDPYFYKNPWNYSCDACHYTCGDCTSPDQSSCINCISPKKYLTNSSGGYCLDSCPTQYYLTTSTSCLSCHFTCSTCNGLTSASCLVCKTGLYKSSGYCRYVCPQATYPDNATSTCLACNTTCTYCVGPTIDNCTGCISSYYLYNQTCVTSCPTPLQPSTIINICVLYGYRAVLCMMMLVMMIVD